MKAKTDKKDPRRAALGLLARREHSRLELVRKLSQRGFKTAEIHKTLDELESLDWLSDGRFATLYVRARQHKGFGPERIGLELQERGVAGELISQALKETETPWEEVMVREWEKRFANKSPEDRQAVLKQQRYLCYRGFSPYAVRQFLKSKNYIV